MDEQTCPRCRGRGRLPIERSAGPPPDCHLCHMTGRVGTTRWAVSPYDGRSHAWFGLGGLEAACTHSAPPGQATEDTGSVPACQACLMIVGMMAVQRGDSRA